MGFPDISTFSESYPGPYEQQMGGYIVSLLKLFTGGLPDIESHRHVAELAASPSCWSAGHAVFNEIRRRFLTATDCGDRMRSVQYAFEESCCQAMYNATDPPDPFDPSSAFFVVAESLELARLIGVPLDAVAQIFASKV